MPRLCLFCSKPSKTRSKEHILPQWLWPYVGMTKVSLIRSVHKGRVGSTSSQPFVIKELGNKAIGTFLEGRVCKQCNNGWMSRLETKVKPLLLFLLDNATLVDELPIEDRKMLALWAVKTSLLAISPSVASRNVPAEHFNAIKQGIISPGISVFAGYHFMVNKRFSYEAGRHWDVAAPAHTPEKLKAEIRHLVLQHSYKVCLQLRSLLLVVAFSPPAQLILSFDDATHQLIWTEGPTSRRRDHPLLSGPRIPFGMLLASDDARRRFTDSLKMVWVPAAISTNAFDTRATDK